MRKHAPAAERGQHNARAALTRRQLLQSAALAPMAAHDAARSATRDDAGTTRADNPHATLRFAINAAETGFDPAQIQDAYSRIVTEHIFDSPLLYDYFARPARLVPNTLLRMPEASADFRTFTFHLRSGIFFADDLAFNGKRRELVAADYVYSYKRLYDPRWKSPMLFVLENSRIADLTELRAHALQSSRPFEYDRAVGGIRALDRYTFQIRLNAPAPRFIALLSDPGVFGAVAREVVERYGDDIMAHPVGSGPYRLAEWRRASRIVLERNPDFREQYFDAQAPADDHELAAEIAPLQGQRLPLLDRVEISVIEEPQPRWLSFLAGEHDLMWRVPTDYADSALPNGKLAPGLARRGMRLTRIADASTTLTYFNMENPVVGGYTPDKVALRRAINLAIDIDAQIRLARQHQAIPAQTAIPPPAYAYDATLRTEMAEHNPARARSLLDLFGYVDRDGDGWREQPDGSPLVLEISSLANQTEQKLNELWERDLRAINVQAKFRVAQWPELLKQSLAGKLMIWGWTWQVTDSDCDSYVGLGYGPNTNQLNDARFNLPQYNRLYEQQRQIADGPERLELIRRAMKLLIAYAPYKFHIHRFESDIMAPWLTGFRRHPFSNRFFPYLALDRARHAA